MPVYPEHLHFWHNSKVDQLKTDGLNRWKVGPRRAEKKRSEEISKKQKERLALREVGCWAIHYSLCKCYQRSRYSKMCSFYFLFFFSKSSLQNLVYISTTFFWFMYLWFSLWWSSIQISQISVLHVKQSHLHFSRLCFWHIVFFFWACWLSISLRILSLIVKESTVALGITEVTWQSSTGHWNMTFPSDSGPEPSTCSLDCFFLSSLRTVSKHWVQ